METIENLVKELTEDQKQLLKELSIMAFGVTIMLISLTTREMSRSILPMGIARMTQRELATSAEERFRQCSKLFTRNFASMEIKENFLLIILIGGVMVLVICSSFATIL